MTEGKRSSALDKLLAAHQAIIDAWYDNWLKNEKARIDAAFNRRPANANN